MIDGYMTVKEASERLSRTTGHIRQLCIDGQLHGVQKVGNTWIIPCESVESYKPGPQGFEAVWQRRRAKEEA